MTRATPANSSSSGARGAGVAPLAGLRFSLVGAGRVGSSLASWAVAAGAELVRTAGRGDLDGLTSAGQELLLIAVPDGAVAEVAGRLAGRRQAAVALHTSGSQEAKVLEPLRAAGAAPGAMHPLKAFPRPLPEVEQARGVFFGLDGDAEATRLARRLVAAWGGVAAEVPAGARPLYHFAATLAAGGVATLLAASADLAARIELPPAAARGYLELARGTVAAALETSTADLAAADLAAAIQPPPAGVQQGGTSARHPAIARQGAVPATAAAVITGPVARGDLATFRSHVEALQAAAPELLPLAIELARETLRLLPPTGRAGSGRRRLLAWIEELDARRPRI
jgi:predicted short-subunit dehydrogenase-like oxidoreductase (DUF2520 family)